jgi:cytochrome c5
MKINLSVACVIMLSGLMLTSLTVSSQTAQKQEVPKASAKNDTSAKAGAQQPEGDRIFQQRCSRCHNAPDGFSPRISGTIARHMRVRASLSKHEEEELLRFLNP